MGLSVNFAQLFKKKKNNRKHLVMCSSSLTCTGHIFFTKASVLRNFTVVFTILNKNVSYSADGVSPPLCACPCKSAHNINSIHDLWAVHSNVLYIPFKAKNIEEIVMKHTHIKKNTLNHRTKKKTPIQSKG